MSSGQPSRSTSVSRQQAQADQARAAGNVAFKSGQYEEAIQRYTESIAALPTATAHSNLAATLFRLSRWQEAESAAKAALALDDSHLKAKLHLGKALLLQGKTQEACPFLAAAYLDDDELAFLLRSADLLASSGMDPAVHQEMAPTHFTKLTAYITEDEGSKVKPAQLSEKAETAPSSKGAGRGQNAATHHKSHAQSDAPKPPSPQAEADNAREDGNTAFKNGMFEVALLYYTRSTDILPTAVAYSNQAAALLKLERWQEAEGAARSALALDSTNAKAQLRLATALRRLGRPREAVPLLAQLLPHFPELKHDLDAAQAEAGKGGAGAGAGQARPSGNTADAPLQQQVAGWRQQIGVCNTMGSGQPTHMWNSMASDTTTSSSHPSSGVLKARLARLEAAHGFAHRKTLEMAHELAMAWAEEGKWDEAEAMLARAAKEGDKVFGSEHSGLLQVLWQGLSHEMMRAGLYERVLPHLKTANTLAQQYHGKNSMAELVLRTHQAFCLVQLKRFEPALLLYRSAHDSLKATHGPDDPHVLNMTVNVVDTLRRAGRRQEGLQVMAAHVAACTPNSGSQLQAKLYQAAALNQADATRKELEMAVQLYRLILARRDKTPGLPQARQILCSLGQTLFYLGQNKEAVESLERAWKMFSQQPGWIPDNPVALTCLTSLVAALSMEGKQKRMLELQDPLLLGFGGNPVAAQDPQVLTVLKAMAAALSSEHKHEDALSFLQLIFTSERKMHGPADERTIDAGMSMARCHWECGTADSRQQATVVASGLLNPVCTSSGQIVAIPDATKFPIQRFLADCLFRMDQYTHAAEHGKEMLATAIRMHKAGLIDERGVVDARHLFSSILTYSGQTKEALHQNQIVLAFYKESGSLGEDAMQALTNIALCHQNAGDLAAAVHHYKMALDGLTQLGSEFSNKAHIVAGSLARCLMQSGDYSEMVSVLRREYDIYAKEQTSHTMASLVVVHDLASSLGKLASDDPKLNPQSITLYREALEGFRTLLGASHETTIQAAAGLGQRMMIIPNPTEAEIAERLALWHSVHQFCQGHYGENHRITIEVTHHLAGCLTKEGRCAEAVPLLEKALAWTRAQKGPTDILTITVETLLNAAMDAANHLSAANTKGSKQRKKPTTSAVAAAGSAPSRATEERVAAAEAAAAALLAEEEAEAEKLKQATEAKKQKKKARQAGKKQAAAAADTGAVNLSGLAASSAAPVTTEDREITSCETDQATASQAPPTRDVPLLESDNLHSSLPSHLHAPTPLAAQNENKPRGKGTKKPQSAPKASGPRKKNTQARDQPLPGAGGADCSSSPSVAAMSGQATDKRPGAATSTAHDAAPKHQPPIAPVGQTLVGGNGGPNAAQVLAAIRLPTATGAMPVPVQQQGANAYLFSTQNIAPPPPAPAQAAAPVVIAAQCGDSLQHLHHLPPNHPLRLAAMAGGRPAEPMPAGTSTTHQVPLALAAMQQQSAVAEPVAHFLAGNSQASGAVTTPAPVHAAANAQHAVAGAHQYPMGAPRQPKVDTGYDSCIREAPPKAKVECCVCLRVRTLVTFQPCGHAICCKGCAKQVVASTRPVCPFCNVGIQGAHF